MPNRPAPVAARAKELVAQGEALLRELRVGPPDSRENALPGNGLTGVIDGLGGLGAQGIFGTQDTAALPYTLANANTWNPVTLNRMLLSYSYMTQGLLATAIDQPVEDAFRGGIRFKSQDLDDEDMKKLNQTFKRKRKRARGGRQTPADRVNVNAGYALDNSDLEACKAVGKWARLFGGAGLIVNTDQDFKRELNVDAIREDSPLSFIAADRWELIMSAQNIYDTTTQTPFNYYGLPLNASRVVRVLGDEAPSFVRLRLQGWGMSMFERCLRPVSAFIKFERVLFELMDEAKVDVYRIARFAATLATANGNDLIRKRMLLTNQLKNFQTALVMDKEDEYDQKTLGDVFNGLAAIWEQLRLNLCAYLRMPMNKLFGQSATGFGSGKDALDNYNAMVGNIREQMEPAVLDCGQLRCQQLFGFVPDDLEVEWTPLSVLDGVETETVKTAKQGRIMERYTAGLTTDKEAMQELRRDELVTCDQTEVEKGIREAAPPVSQNPDEVAAGRDHEKDMADAANKAKAKERQIGRGAK